MIEIEEKTYEQGRIDGLKEAYDIVNMLYEMAQNDPNTTPMELYKLNIAKNFIAYRKSK